jgi:hypothetical protein
MPSDTPIRYNTPPTIRVYMGVNIGIHRSVLRFLGNPESLHFWWSESEKALLVAPCPAQSRAAVPISTRYYETNNGCVFSNRQLMRAIQNLTGWPDGSKNKIKGSCLPEQKMVAFRINEAITEVRSNG